MNTNQALGVLLMGLAIGCEKPEDHSRALDPLCREAYEAEGSAVTAQHASCESDADCVLVAGPGCLSPFLCYDAVARGQEVAFTSAAEAVIGDYIDECGDFCAIADCVSESDVRAVCDTGTGLCSSAFRGGQATEAVGGAP